MVCGGKDSSGLFRGLLKCATCGFVWADLRLSEEDLRKMYEKNYFFGGEYRDYLAEEGPIRKDFERNLKLLLPHSSGGKLLELGSAYGFFLDRAKPHFSSVEGVELNAEASRYAREKLNLKVGCGDFLSMDLPSSTFDTLVCWATLEHLQTPDLYIEKISRLLKPGGVFAFTTCDMETLIPKLRGAKWRTIHPPTHVSYWSRRSLEWILKRFGMTTLFYKHIGQVRSVDSVLYAVLVLNGLAPKLYAFIKKLGLARGTFYMNTFDVIYMAVRKEAGSKV